MPLISKRFDAADGPSGTHKPKTGVRCWGRQQGLGSKVYMARWGGGWLSGPTSFLEKLENFVRLTNLHNLKGTYSTCPFRKGCELDGDPPLPADHREYMSEERPMVDA